MAGKNRVQVDIFGQRIALTGIDDPEYAQRLASLVDARMKAIRGGTNLDFSKVALLTAINLADELLQTKDRLEVTSADVESDARRLTALLEAAFS